MKKIFKYTLWETPYQEIEMQLGAEILCVDYQGDKLQLWALVDTNMPVKKELIEIFGTGQEMPEIQRVYLSTVQKGGYVWHIFKRIL